MSARRSLRYREADTPQAVKERKSGALDSIQAARVRYGTAGGATVQRWLRKHGKCHLPAEVGACADLR